MCGTGLLLVVSLPSPCWPPHNRTSLSAGVGAARADAAAALTEVQQYAKATVESNVWPLCSSLLSLPRLALPDVVGHFRVVINNNKSPESVRAGCFLPPLGLEGCVFFQTLRVLVKGSCHMGTGG